MHVVANVVAVVDACKWAVVIREISKATSTAINRPLTTKRIPSVWMIYVVLPTRVQTEHQVNRCPLVQHPCFHHVAIVVAKWALVVH
jgi:hypothetical protein